MKTRGQEVGNGETIQLSAQFYDVNTGLPADLSLFPTIQITENDGSIYMQSTSAGVYKINTGLYGFDFTIPINAPSGVWTDTWNGTLNSNTFKFNFNFIVSNTDLPSPPIDGYEHLGDEPIVQYSQEAIHNLNILIRILRRRLQSSGVHKVKDAYGNWVMENCDIFSLDELSTFLCASLSEFNSTPHFTLFTWENEIVVDYRDVIVEGAYIIALASKALIEKGREFTISDNGINFTPPAVADALSAQVSTLLSAYREKLKYIKANMKPAPLGLGTLRITAVAPQILRLRHRREIQFL